MPQRGARTVPVRSARAGRGALEKGDVFGPDNPLRTGTVRGPVQRDVATAPTIHTNPICYKRAWFLNRSGVLPLVDLRSTTTLNRYRLAAWRRNSKRHFQNTL